MKLTGKCKQEFLKKHNTTSFYFETHYIELFQNALIIDFLDSVGIYIGLEYGDNEEFFYSVFYHFENSIIDTNRLSRSEATNAAIKKANEIYNEKFK